MLLQLTLIFYRLRVILIRLQKLHILWDIATKKMVEIPPKISVSGFMGYLKGKSAAMMYEQFVELKYKYRSKEFWCKGYYVDTVGKNEGRIAEYIKNQLKEDQLGDQLSIPL